MWIDRSKWFEEKLEMLKKEEKEEKLGIIHLHERERGCEGSNMKFRRGAQFIIFDRG